MPTPQPDDITNGVDADPLDTMSTGPEFDADLSAALDAVEVARQALDAIAAVLERKAGL